MNDLSAELAHGANMINTERKNSKRSAFAQVVATLIQCWLLVATGLEASVPTLVIGALHNHPEEKLCMDDDQASWFGSLSPIAQLMACALTGFIQDRFGRKGSMILVSILTVFAWLSLYCANSVGALYAASILMGLCSGLCEAPLHSYIGEVCEPHMRGRMSTLSTASFSFSVLCMFTLGYLSDWRTAALIGAAEAVAATIFMTQIPESPMWLISKNRLEDAQKSLSWLRGWVKPEEVQKEFLGLVKYTKSSNEECKPEPTQNKLYGVHQSRSKDELLATRGDSYLVTKLKEITDKRVLLPLRMVITTIFFVFTTSLMAIKPYQLEIYNSYGSSIDGKLILVIQGVVFLLGMAVNLILLRRLGKRRIALFSQILATTCILLLGVYCCLFLKSKLFPGSTLIPVILTLAVGFCTGFGLLPFSWHLLTEILPPQGRGIAVGIAAAWTQLVRFALAKSFLYLRNWITLGGTMFLYGAISVIGALYVYFNVPETEGKTLAEIQKCFTKDSDRRELFSVGKPGSESKSSVVNNDQQTQSATPPKEEF